MPLSSAVLCSALRRYATPRHATRRRRRRDCELNLTTSTTPPQHPNLSQQPTSQTHVLAILGGRQRLHQAVALAPGKTPKGTLDLRRSSSFESIFIENRCSTPCNPAGVIARDISKLRAKKSTLALGRTDLERGSDARGRHSGGYYSMILSFLA